MAQRPTRTLNLLLVPDDPERRPDAEALARAWGALVAGGVVLPSGRPGPAAGRLGDFARLRVDLRPEGAIYGNRQGGFTAACPACGASVVPALHGALSAWRAGRGRSLCCPGCGAAHDLCALRFAPEAALGRFALDLRDVGSPTLGADADVLALLAEALGGGHREILSRG